MEQAHTQPKRWVTILLIVLAFALMGGMLAMPFATEILRHYGFVMANAWPLVIVVSLSLLFGAIKLDNWLMRVLPAWTSRSIYGLKIKVNMAVLPLKTWKLAVLYTPLLLIAIPIVAFYEEFAFRYMLSGPVAVVLWGGVAFGLVHVLSFVPMRMLVTLTVSGIALGVMFSIVSAIAGPEIGLIATTAFHATYNIAFALLTLFMLYAHKPLLAWFAGDCASATAARRHLPTMHRWLRNMEAS